MLILSGGSDVTLSGGVDEVNRWQKGNILNDSLSAESWAGERGELRQEGAELSQATKPRFAFRTTPVVIRYVTTA